jgi:CheY-like chemotaxis protein
MPQGGELAFATRTMDFTAPAPEKDLAAGRYLDISITDSGCGMDEQTRKRLFEPFFTTKAPGKGTGLGLSVVFGIVRSHGGEIACHSREGEGTRFSIRIPAMRRLASGQYRAITSAGTTRTDLQSIGATPGPAVNITALRGTESVLVIDDDMIVRETVQSLLATLGYTARAANGGADALKLLDAEAPFKPALVLLDVVMPGLAGPALYKELHARLPGVPIVLISGYSQDQTIQEMLSLGARELVQKPFTLENIAVVLRRHLTPATIT